MHPLPAYLLAQRSLLMDDEKERLRNERLSHTVDTLRQTFGPDSIQRGSAHERP